MICSLPLFYKVLTISICAIKAPISKQGRWLSLNSVLGYLGYFPKIFAPKMRTSIKRTRKIKNNILAIEAAPAAMPVKPKIAAIIAIMKNIAAHLSISQSLKGEQLFITYLKFSCHPVYLFSLLRKLQSNEGFRCS